VSFEWFNEPGKDNSGKNEEKKRVEWGFGEHDIEEELRRLLKFFPNR
jgi:hypothetical protein